MADGARCNYRVRYQIPRARGYEQTLAVLHAMKARRGVYATSADQFRNLDEGSRLLYKDYLHGEQGLSKKLMAAGACCIVVDLYSISYTPLETKEKKSESKRSKKSKKSKKNKKSKKPEMTEGLTVAGVQEDQQVKDDRAHENQEAEVSLDAVSRALMEERCNHPSQLILPQLDPNGTGRLQQYAEQEGLVLGNPLPGAKILTQVDMGRYRRVSATPARLWPFILTKRRPIFTMTRQLVDEDVDLCLEVAKYVGKHFLTLKLPHVTSETVEQWGIEAQDPMILQADFLAAFAAMRRMTIHVHYVGASVPTIVKEVCLLALLTSLSQLAAVPSFRHLCYIQLILGESPDVYHLALLPDYRYAELRADEGDHGGDEAIHHHTPSPIPPLLPGDTDRKRPKPFTVAEEVKVIVPRA